MTESEKLLLKALEPILTWWTFVEAGESIDSESLGEVNRFDDDPQMVVLHYMGNGASYMVTVEQLRNLCKKAGEVTSE